eukprot:COSAG01_NODE_4076_length_5380_cov_5.943950_6_plen_189_part_00
MLHCSKFSWHRRCLSLPTLCQPPSPRHRNLSLPAPKQSHDIRKWSSQANHPTILSTNGIASVTHILIRVRVQIMGSQTYRHVGKSQSVIVVQYLIVSTRNRKRTRSTATRGPLLSIPCRSIQQSGQPRSLFVNKYSPKLRSDRRSCSSGPHGTAGQKIEGKVLVCLATPGLADYAAQVTQSARAGQVR